MAQDRKANSAPRAPRAMAAYVVRFLVQERWTRDSEFQARLQY